MAFIVVHFYFPTKLKGNSYKYRFQYFYFVSTLQNCNLLKFMSEIFTFQLLFCIYRVEDIVVEAKLIPFPSSSILTNLSDPSSTVSTKYHYLVLTKEKIFIVSIINGDIIQEIKLKKEFDGIPGNLIQDPATNSILLQSDSTIFQVKIDLL